MILFFDWPKIKKRSGKKVSMIRAIFFSLMDYEEPHFAARRLNKDFFIGDSYLLQPERLLNAFLTGNQVDAANYLMLASYRNYADFKVTGDCTLPLKYVTIPQTKLETNSLIDIKGNAIHFLLEI